MIDTIKLHSGRIVRIMIGISFVVMGFMKSDNIGYILGSIFLIQGIMNVGMCGMGQCSIPQSSQKDELKKSEP